MCGRFTQLAAEEEIVDHYNPHKISTEIRRCYNVAPSQSVAVLVRNEQGEKELVGLTWGLIPHWAKDPAKLKPQINARSETVGEKPFFRDAFKRSRCVVPASGYYEWAKKESGKQPYYIHGKDSSLLSLAGVWATCVMPESRLQTFTILTKDAPSAMSTLHHRVPLILSPADIETWLSGSAAEVGSLLGAGQEDELSWFPVSTFVNSPKNDSEQCIQPQQ